MRRASIIALVMSVAGAGAASGTSSVLEVDTIAEVDFVSVSETRVGAVSVGKSSDGKVWCNLFEDVERCDRCNVIASNVIACSTSPVFWSLVFLWSILGRCNRAGRSCFHLYKHGEKCDACIVYRARRPAVRQ